METILQIITGSAYVILLILLTRWIYKSAYKIGKIDALIGKIRYELKDNNNKKERRWNKISIKSFNSSKSNTNMLLDTNEFTGYFDDTHKPIFIGDKLKSEYNYNVIVTKDENGEYNGRLVCNDKHSCKNIPYDLNKGKGYRKIKDK